MPHRLWPEWGARGRYSHPLCRMVPWRPTTRSVGDQRSDQNIVCAADSRGRGIWSFRGSDHHWLDNRNHIRPLPSAKYDFPSRRPGNNAINGSIRSLSVATQGTELAAAGDLPCQGFSGGCQSGGDWGTTAVYSVSGRGLCANCAVKSLGIQDMPAGEKAIILRPFILPGN